MIDVVVIGAGASGLTASIVAARRGKKVLILEKNSKVGKKLLATGNGKCNITNQKININRFHSQNSHFIEQMLDGYRYRTIKEFFKSIGLELIESKEGKVFPMSLQASSVVELLLYECEKLGVIISCEREVKSISKLKNSYRVEDNRGEIFCKKLVIATGHLSYPQLGGVDDGVNFAKNLGHTSIKSFPSLVQLTSTAKEAYLKQMAGVKIESRVTLQTPQRSIEREGDILFTNYGISGLAILDISRFVMMELLDKRSVTLTIDLMPKMSNAQLLALMRKSLVKKSSKPLAVWLQGFINKKLILPILEPLKLNHLTVGLLKSNMNDLEKIVTKIKAFEFMVNGSRGYRGAEVTTGGINTKEIEAKTMESKINKNLYFIGEVLDVDGDRGGFNLHFAWVCGIRAGYAI